MAVIIGVVGVDAGVGGAQVGGVEQVGLGLKGARGKDAVLGHDGELVQHQDVGRRERRDEHGRGRVVEGVEEGRLARLLLVFVGAMVAVGGRRGRLWCFGLVGERGGEAELELRCKLWSVLVMFAGMDGTGTRTGIELTLISATWVGKKCTSPLAHARWNVVLTSSGRLAGTLTGAVMVSLGWGQALQEESDIAGRKENARVRIASMRSLAVRALPLHLQGCNQVPY